MSYGMITLQQLVVKAQSLYRILVVSLIWPSDTVFLCIPSRAGNLPSIHNPVMGETVSCEHPLLKLDPFTGVGISSWVRPPSSEPEEGDASPWRWLLVTFFLHPLLCPKINQDTGSCWGCIELFLTLGSRLWPGWTSLQQKHVSGEVSPQRGFWASL